MSSIIDFPYESSECIEFSAYLKEEPVDCQFVRIFKLLIEGIGEKGIKATSSGNLPRKLVREIAGQAMTKGIYDIMSESNFRELFLVRLVSTSNDFILKSGGKFVVSKNCRKYMDRSGLKEIFPRLLYDYSKTFNWAYMDYDAKASSIQKGFPFTLYLLSRFGAEWRNPDFYANAFSMAFPKVIDDFRGESLDERFNNFRKCYRRRSLVNYARFCGLIDVEFVDIEHEGLLKHIKKSRMFDDIVQFHVRSAL
jgi:hypothetical protein